MKYVLFGENKKRSHAICFMCLASVYKISFALPLAQFPTFRPIIVQFLFE
jgi:hypothetical protein